MLNLTLGVYSKIKANITYERPRPGKMEYITLQFKVKLVWN